MAFSQKESIIDVQLNFKNSPECKIIRKKYYIEMQLKLVNHDVSNVG